MKKRDVMSEPFLSNRTKRIILVIILLLASVTALIFCINLINRKVYRAEELVLQGNTKFDEMEYEQAELKYKEAIALQSDNTSAYLGLEKIYLVNGDLYNAVSVLEAGYKKTENSQILEELERIKGKSENKSEVNRSALSVEEAADSDDTYESTLITAANIQGSPGETQVNKAVIPDIDSDIVKSAAAESEKENSAEDEKNSSDNSNQSDKENTDDIQNDQENTEGNLSVTFVKLNINESEYLVSSDQWKRWYNLWKIELLKNNPEYNFEDLNQSEWELWYQALKESKVIVEDKLIMLLSEENGWSNLSEFWKWLTENL